MIKTSLPNGCWIICGDLNMTEHLANSFGSSPLLNGKEKESWRLLKRTFHLADCFSLLGQVVGPRFTRREVRDIRLDQSRINRFYASDHGWWTVRLVELVHDPNQTLSDHDPILLKLQLIVPDPLEAHLKHSTYFKANPYILRKPENLARI